MATHSIRCSFSFILFLSIISKLRNTSQRAPTIDSSVPSHLKRPTRSNLVPQQSRKKAYEDINNYFLLNQELDKHTFILMASYFNYDHGEVFS